MQTYKESPAASMDVPRATSSSGVASAAAPAAAPSSSLHGQLSELIFYKHNAQRRIDELEATVAELQAQLNTKLRSKDEDRKGVEDSKDGEATSGGEEISARRPTSAPFGISTTPRHGTSLEDITRWNRELVSTVEKLQQVIVKCQADSRAQVVLLTDELEMLARENERLRGENDCLNQRVAEDVLRERQTNRIEMAVEKAKIASRVRAAGLRRLEYMESTLMEAHDDIYHVQRWDAAVVPQRDVSFVFHFVADVAYPLSGVEEFVMSVYQQILFNTSRVLSGHHVASCFSMEVFAFQNPIDALNFAKESHVQVVRLSWPERCQQVPFFSTITEYGTVLFRGPRIHTCVYSCTPESLVNAVNGRSIFFGAEVRAAVETALELSSVGEIAVNDAWAHLACRQLRMDNDSGEPVIGDVMDVRLSLGKEWDVVGAGGSAAHDRGIIASLIPASLKGRRGISVVQLGPTAKFPSQSVDAEALAVAVIKAMKGLKVEMAEMTGGRKRVIRFVEANERNDKNTNEKYDIAAKLLQLYSLQQDKENVTALYRKCEQTCAVLERAAMEAEDRFELAKRKPLDPSETVFVCTIDTGDDAMWKKIVLSNMSPQEFDVLRNSLRLFIHNCAKEYYGFLMNGNYVDVFTYVFREAEQALAFVSEVYTMVNRTGTKYSYVSQGTGQEVFLFRAGMAGGMMSSIYRNLDSGVLKCTGPVIRLSGTLCDIARFGEILAREDVIKAFYGKTENLSDMQYNIVKQPSQFLSGSDAPSVVHSILPRPFAYRRTQLMESEEKEGQRSRQSYKSEVRSAKAALMVQKRQYAQENVADLLQQQLNRLERAEAGFMAEEDVRVSSPCGRCEQDSLRNPWMLTSQLHLCISPPLRRHTSALAMTTEHDGGPAVKLGFLFCDIAGVYAISRSLPSGLARRVYSHYNYIVQLIVMEWNGYIAKTNSNTAYVVIFSRPELALEAAVEIHHRLLATTWPDELRTLEPTLFVRDAKTGILLFNGPRPQIAVHCSTRYNWKKVGEGVGPSNAGGPSGSTSSLVGSGNVPASSGGNSVINAAAIAASGNGKRRVGSAGIGRPTSGTTATPIPLAADSSTMTRVHVYGSAIEELLVLGRHARGGETRLSRELLENVGTSTHGKLLVSQLAMEVINTPSSLSVSASARKRSSAGRSSLSEQLTAADAAAAAAAAAATTVPSRKNSSLSDTRRSLGSFAGSSARAAAAVATAEWRRETISGNTANPSRQRQKGVSQAAIAAAAAAVEQCVSAVPRQLVGRVTFFQSFGVGASPFPLLAAAVAGGGGEPGLATGSETQSPTVSPKAGGGDSSSANEGRSGSVLSTSMPAICSTASAKEKRGTSPSPFSPSPSSKPKSVPKPPPTEAQLTWCTDAHGSFNALPNPSRGPWDLPPAEAVDGRPLSEKVQEALETMMTIFVSPQQHEESGAAAAAALADGNVNDDGVKSPISPKEGSRKQWSSDAAQSDEKAVVAMIPLMPLQKDSKEKASYKALMRISKELLAVIHNALRVANERAKPPPVPKDIVLVDPAPSTTTLPSVHGASSRTANSLPSPISGSGSQRYTGSLTLVPPAPPPIGMSQLSGPQSGSSEGGRASGRGKRPRVDHCKVALDYLDECCKSLSFQTGLVLGKMSYNSSSLPSAPKAGPQKNFPGSRR